MKKTLTLSILILFLISCSKNLYVGNGGYSDVSLSRNSDEYTIKRIPQITMEGNSIFGIPGFGVNNKNKSKYGMVVRFNGLELGKTPRVMPVLTLIGFAAASTLAVQKLGGTDNNPRSSSYGDYKLKTGVSALIGLPIAGAANNILWNGAALSGLSNQINHQLVSENQDIDVFFNPKYFVDYKLGLFNQKATVTANVMGATLKIK